MPRQDVHIKIIASFEFDDDYKLTAEDVETIKQSVVPYSLLKNDNDWCKKNFERIQEGWFLADKTNGHLRSVIVITYTE